jgi:hypothetical protein
MDAEVAVLRRKLSIQKRKRAEQNRSTRAETRAALRMIREVVEMHAPSGSVLPEERGGAATYGGSRGADCGHSRDRGSEIEQAYARSMRA